MNFRMVEKGTSLCRSCRQSHILKFSNSEDVIYCMQQHPAMVVFRPVAECNQYEEFGKMTEYEANKVGWVLETKGTAIIGFKPPKRDKDE